MIDRIDLVILFQTYDFTGHATMPRKIERMAYAFGVTVSQLRAMTDVSHPYWKDIKGRCTAEPWTEYGRAGYEDCTAQERLEQLDAHARFIERQYRAEFSHRRRRMDLRSR